MLKLLGGLLVVGGCAVWGIAMAQELVGRAHLLEELIQTVRLMERELVLFRPALPDLLQRMAQGRCKPICDLCNNCCSLIEQGKSFTDIWEQQVKKLPLTEQEKQVLVGLGQVVGRYDDKGQEQAVSRIRLELEDCAALAREESRSKGKMYRVLGVTAGAFLLLTIM